MWDSRIFFLLCSVAELVESGTVAREPYDALRLQAVEDKAKSIDLDDASTMLDIIHDQTKKLSAAARSDEILGKAQIDLWRKEQDQKDFTDLKVLAASERAEDAVHEREKALKDTSRARVAMVIAAKEKVKAENRVRAAQNRVDDAEVHIEEIMAKKEAAKKIMAGPLARMHTYPAPSEASKVQVVATNEKADAEEREEEAMAFVKADKDVKGTDEYKAPAEVASESKPVVVSAAAEEVAEDQKEAQREMAIAKASAAKEVSNVLAGAKWNGD